MLPCWMVPVCSWLLYPKAGGCCCLDRVLGCCPSRGNSFLCHSAFCLAWQHPKEREKSSQPGPSWNWTGPDWRMHFSSGDGVGMELAAFHEGFTDALCTLPPVPAWALEEMVSSRPPAWQCGRRGGSLPAEGPTASLQGSCCHCWSGLGEDLLIANSGGELESGW